MLLHNLGGTCQANTCSLNASRHVLASSEWVENRRKIRVGDTKSLVTHSQYSPCVLSFFGLRYRQRDPPTMRTVLNSIG
jgi:hypothetical protein